MLENNRALLECKNIYKRFKGVEALNNVNFDIYPGMVHGLIGENGAGKSTLIKIISGVYRLDSGYIYQDGKSILIKNTEDMLRRGVATIYQDINLVKNMTVAENIFLNNELKFKFSSILNENEMRKRTSKLLKEYDINVDPNTLIKDLPNDINKMIQILKALFRNAKILLMDEPTSSLTGIEEKQVLKLIRTLANKGIGTVFISHYLSEVFEVCDIITILRDGKLVDTVKIKDTSMSDTIEKMIGKTIDKEATVKESYKKEKVILKVDSLYVKGKLKNVSFDLNHGEVLGFTGLVGSGCSELAKAIFGSLDTKKEKGSFFLNGKKIKIDHPKNAIENKIAYITDDRVSEGLFQELSIHENISLPILNKFRRKNYLIDEKNMLKNTYKYIKALDIKTPSAFLPVQSLSGGNQQKVLFAKGLGINPRIFIMSEPTIGIDVGTKYEIRKMIKRMASNGVSIILFTNELEELEGLCDRVLVLFRGEIVKELKDSDITRENIIAVSTTGGS